MTDRRRTNGRTDITVYTALGCRREVRTRLNVQERIRVAERSHVVGRLELENFDERVDMSRHCRAASEQHQVERRVDVLISELDSSFSQTAASVIRATHVTVPVQTASPTCRPSHDLHAGYFR